MLNKNKPERSLGLQVRDGDFIEFEFKSRHYSHLSKHLVKPGLYFIKLIVGIFKTLMKRIENQWNDINDKISNIVESVPLNVKCVNKE